MAAKKSSKSTRRAYTPMVFDDPDDVEAFVAAVRDHADDPALVLHVAQSRALDALRASGVDVPADYLRLLLGGTALDVAQAALAKLVLICQRTDSLSTNDVDGIRDAATAVYGWQAHVRVFNRETNRERLLRQQLEAIRGRWEQVARDEQKKLEGVKLLQAEADRLRKADPTRAVEDIRTDLVKFPGATDRMVRAVKITRARKKSPRP